jgi:hypothetical protein
MSQENVEVDDRVLHAADNNARWCDLVCRSHGIPTAFQYGLWVALRRSPDLYPDAVTLIPGLATEDVLRSVQDGPGCSVKDSFDALDLAPMGFDELFRAQWIFREPAPSRPNTALAWTVVETDEAFREWTRAAGLSGIFRSSLLRNPSVRILAVHGPNGLTAGAVANRTGPVVGVSNVFTTTIAADEAWAGIPHALAVVFPSLPLVGYEQEEDLQAALGGGFTEVGALRVWLSVCGQKA